MAWPSMQFLGEPEEERAFRQELALRGLREQDVMLTDFYPEAAAAWANQL